MHQFVVCQPPLHSRRRRRSSDTPEQQQTAADAFITLSFKLYFIFYIKVIRAERQRETGNRSYIRESVHAQQLTAGESEFQLPWWLTQSFSYLSFLISGLRADKSPHIVYFRRSCDNVLKRRVKQLLDVWTERITSCCALCRPAGVSSGAAEVWRGELHLNTTALKTFIQNSSKPQTDWSETHMWSNCCCFKSRPLHGE